MVHGAGCDYVLQRSQGVERSFLPACQRHCRVREQAAVGQPDHRHACADLQPCIAEVIAECPYPISDCLPVF
jgi:hypothetical protein